MNDKNMYIDKKKSCISINRYRTGLAVTNIVKQTNDDKQMRLFGIILCSIGMLPYKNGTYHTFS